MNKLPSGHTPVLLAEVLDVLRPKDGGIYIDGTFGAGGYAQGLLDAVGCRVWGIDRDPNVIARADALVRRYEGRLQLVQGRFSEMDRLMQERGIDAADGVALDLGVSSMQLDEPSRGFSFRFDGPLDMRMSSSGPTAAELIARASEHDLADVIFTFGAPSSLPERKPRSKPPDAWPRSCAGQPDRAPATASIRRRAPSRPCVSG